jgi:hypothetical protein
LLGAHRFRRGDEGKARRRVWHAALEAFEKQSGASTAATSVVERREFWRNWNEQHR